MSSQKGETQAVPPSSTRSTCFFGRCHHDFRDSIPGARLVPAPLAALTTFADLFHHGLRRRRRDRRHRSRAIRPARAAEARAPVLRPPSPWSTWPIRTPLEIYELYVADAANPSAGSVKLSGPLVAGGYVDEYAVTRDGEAVVYTADEDTLNRRELYIVELDKPGKSTRLNVPLTVNRDVLDFAVSPDGKQVVYRADQDTSDVFEFYLVEVATPGNGGEAQLDLWRRTAGFARSSLQPRRALSPIAPIRTSSMRSSCIWSMCPPPAFRSKLNSSARRGRKRYPSWSPSARTVLRSATSPTRTPTKCWSSTRPRFHSRHDSQAQCHAHLRRRRVPLRVQPGFNASRLLRGSGH